MSRRLKRPVLSTKGEQRLPELPNGKQTASLSKLELLEKRLQVRHTVEFISELVDSLDPYVPDLQLVTVEELDRAVCNDPNKIYRLRSFERTEERKEETFKLDDMIEGMKEAIDNLEEGNKHTLTCINSVETILGMVGKKRNLARSKQDFGVQVNLDSEKENTTKTLENSEFQVLVQLNDERKHLELFEFKGNLETINELLDEINISLNTPVQQANPIKNLTRSYTKSFRNPEQVNKKSVPKKERITRKLTFKETPNAAPPLNTQRNRIRLGIHIRHLIT